MGSVLDTWTQRLMRCPEMTANRHGPQLWSNHAATTVCHVLPMICQVLAAICKVEMPWTSPQNLSRIAIHRSAILFKRSRLTWSHWWRQLL